MDGIALCIHPAGACTLQHCRTWARSRPDRSYPMTINLITSSDTPIERSATLRATLCETRDALHVLQKSLFVR